MGIYKDYRTEQEKQEQLDFFSIFPGNERSYHAVTLDADVVMPFECFETANLTYGYNRYFSPNIIKQGGKRCVTDVLFLCANFLDLDLMHGEPRFHSVSEAYYAFLDVCYQELGYSPTAVVNSGYGLHIYFAYPSIIKATIGNLRKWHEVQDKLCEIFADFNPDKGKAKDQSSLLRIPNTMNKPKDPKREPCACTILELYPEKKHSLSGLHEVLFGVRKATDAQQVFLGKIKLSLGIDIPGNHTDTAYKAYRNIATYKGEYINCNYASKEATPAMVSFATLISEKLGVELPSDSDFSTLWEFIHDNKPAFIEYITNIKAQNAEMPYGRPVSDGTDCFTAGLLNFIKDHPENIYQRETTLFLLRYHSTFTSGEKKGWEITREANSWLSEPLDLDYLKARTNSAVTYCKQQTKRSFYPKAMATLIGDKVLPYFNAGMAAVKKANRAATQHKYYISKLEKQKKITKEAKIAARIRKVQKFLNGGMSIKDIAHKLKVSVATINRDIKSLKATNNAQETSADKCVKNSDRYLLLTAPSVLPDWCTSDPIALYSTPSLVPAASVPYLAEYPYVTMYHPEVSEMDCPAKFTVTYSRLAEAVLGQAGWRDHSDPAFHALYSVGGVLLKEGKSSPLPAIRISRTLMYLSRRAPEDIKRYMKTFSRMCSAGMGTIETCQAAEKAFLDVFRLEKLEDFVVLLKDAYREPSDRYKFFEWCKDCDGEDVENKVKSAFRSTYILAKRMAERIFYISRVPLKGKVLHKWLKPRANMENLHNIIRQISKELDKTRHPYSIIAEILEFKPPISSEPLTLSIS